MVVAAVGLRWGLVCLGCWIRRCCFHDTCTSPEFIWRHLCHDAITLKVTRDSFICVVWLIHVWYVSWLIHMCCMSHSYVLFVQLIHMCCLTHSYVLFVWLIHMCCMTHSCVVPLIHESLLSGSYICADMMIWLDQLDKLQLVKWDKTCHLTRPVKFYPTAQVQDPDMYHDAFTFEVTHDSFICAEWLIQM